MIWIALSLNYWPMSSYLVNLFFDWARVCLSWAVTIFVWIRYQTKKSQLCITNNYLQTDIIVASAMGICLKGVEQIV
jgi:hypothetical protein